MKKMVAILLVLMTLFAAGCASRQNDTPEETEIIAGLPEEGTVGMANPWTEVDSLADAEAAAGFPFPQPKWDVAYDTVIYRVTDGIIEVIYEQDDGQRITLRKGADETDISGDYTDYTFTENKNEITVKGENAELCKAATWITDGHFCALFCDLPETMDAMVQTAQLIDAAQ